MEVRIRLQKSDTTAQGRYTYRIVAIPREDKRQGRALEFLGWYDAAKKPAQYQIDLEKLDKWLEKGARMTDTVKSLANKQRKAAK
ncbi:MAG: 30S ribosomal protein S16 [Candidatus Omnitrophota bacterium]